MNIQTILAGGEPVFIREDFDMGKWTALHEHHSDDHPHPHGVMPVRSSVYLRTYRLGRRNLDALERDQSGSIRRYIELMLRVNLFRYQKTGHIGIGRTMEISIDRNNDTLYVWYEAYDVPVEWSCVVGSKVLRDEQDDAEERQMISGLKRALAKQMGIDDESRPKMPVH